MEFPPEWNILPAEDFEIAVPRDPGEIGVDLMAQIRNNGRILDHFRLVLGGSKLLEAAVPLKNILPTVEAPDWTLKVTCWPRDVKLRRNMATSAWLDIKEQLASNDARVSDSDGVLVENKLLLDFLDELADKQMNSASTRWWVGAGEDGRLHLQLQAIPSPANSHASKPAWKG